MRRVVQEPLVHFLLAGVLLFVGFAWLNRENQDEPRVVRITAEEVKWLTETWTRQWQRPPTQQELHGIAADYLKEQLLAREARELGLDQDDTVVRRRLAQKLEFLVEDTSRLADPSEDELRHFYDGDPARYQIPARVTFSQIFFHQKSTGAQALAELQQRESAEFGDPTLLVREMAAADKHTVDSVFGPEFFERILELEPGKWQGPVQSAYGFHLVQVIDREVARSRPFEEVKSQVLDEWRRQQQAEAAEQFFASLLKKYEVVIDESVRPLVGSLAGASQ